MSSPVNGLAVEDVHVWRGDRHVLRGISLGLAGGQLLHVFGANGSGKTTLLRVVCGLLRPEQGRVSWLGKPIGQVRAQYQAALAYGAHEPALKGDLTAIENLRFAVGLKRRASEEELRSSLERTEVLACADLPARVLSAGQRRRITWARLLAMRARLWLLDEPFTNLDARGGELMTRLLEEHVREGGMALVVAHQALKLSVGVSRLELAP